MPCLEKFSVFSRLTEKKDTSFLYYAGEKILENLKLVTL